MLECRGNRYPIVRHFSRLPNVRWFRSPASVVSISLRRFIRRWPFWLFVLNLFISLVFFLEVFINLFTQQHCRYCWKENPHNCRRWMLTCLWLESWTLTYWSIVGPCSSVRRQKTRISETPQKFLPWRDSREVLLLTWSNSPFCPHCGTSPVLAYLVTTAASQWTAWTMQFIFWRSIVDNIWILIADIKITTMRWIVKSIQQTLT